VVASCLASFVDVAVGVVVSVIPTTLAFFGRRLLGDWTSLLCCRWGFLASGDRDSLRLCGNANTILGVICVVGIVFLVGAAQFCIFVLFATVTIFLVGAAQFCRFVIFASIVAVVFVLVSNDLVPLLAVCSARYRERVVIGCDSLPRSLLRQVLVLAFEAIDVSLR